MRPDAGSDAGAGAAVPIRDAASVILVRDTATSPRVLMGQRGAGAAFMPMKFVFPGGAVDPADADIALANPLPADCRVRLAAMSPGVSPEALAVAALRELWEEAGLILGVPGTWPGAVPAGWEGFAAAGCVPSAAALSFVFRAITPPGRPRRFDARFLLAEAGALAGDPDDFSRASDELAHLRWVPLEDVRRIDLPFITEVVLAEVAARLRGRASRGVPFFKNDTAVSEFVWL